MRRGVMAAAVLGLSLLTACGYHAGAVGGESETLAVAMYGNRTREPLLEKELTNFLISELVRSPSFVPLNPGQSSDLSLEGDVTGYANTAVAYDADDDIVRYLVSVSALTTLREEPSGRVLWKGGAEASQEYPADDDKDLQRQFEEQARLAAIERLAEEIVQRLGQRF